MKVVCIVNKDYEKDLIIGKIYNVEFCGIPEHYIITDNVIWANVFDKKYFKPISEIRNETIDKILK